MPVPRAKPISLSDEQRQDLQRLVRAASRSASENRRAARVETRVSTPTGPLPDMRGTSRRHLAASIGPCGPGSGFPISKGRPELTTRRPSATDHSSRGLPSRSPRACSLPSSQPKSTSVRPSPSRSAAINRLTGRPRSRCQRSSFPLPPTGAASGGQVGHRADGRGLKQRSRPSGWACSTSSPR